MRQLEMADALFVLTEQPSRNTQHIGMIFLFDPSTAEEPVTFESIVDLFRRRIPLARGFREKLVRVPMDLDYPYWINDDSFDLEFHVRQAALPRPGTRRQFLTTANRIMSLPIDMSRPLWEAWVVEGLDNMDDVPKGTFALLFKMHHSAVDGISGMEMVTALLEDESIAQAKMPTEPWEAEPVPDQATLLRQAIGSSFSSPMKLANALLRNLPTIASDRRKMNSGEIIKPAKVKAPKTRFNSPVTPHKVIDGRSFAFEDIRRIKNAIPGATVNDVVVGIVGGALRRYLTDKGELPDTSLVVTVPISMRTQDQEGTGGNQLSFSFIPAHTDIADPVARVEAVGAVMREVKAYNKAVDARTLAKTTAAMPGMLIGLAMRTMMTLPANDLMIMSNAVITNVPGPMEPKSLLGARYVAGFAAGPSADGIGLIHAITSLSGILSIGFSACRELMPDSEFYGQCIQESYEELAAAVAERGKAPAPTARKPKAAAKKREASPPRTAKSAANRKPRASAKSPRPA
ncbi:diacylglycerol O-acyltransferase [Novosphingobium endophyticum]|uniref:diacylglycerol O-acyltransferase n=2 Tax=Novosphingobium endophyticum TaxID=1955250 RepID=A0A916TUH9_9SPHN|nr:diacylglycerol O-acyltransferase [Novosphingobium endophyticum]